jgi:hypothetical protein
LHGGTVYGPGAACPCCGYHAVTSDVADPASKAIDYEVVDPERWQSPTGEPPPPPLLGHSAYHDHAAFRAHVDHVVASVDTST